MAELFHSSTGGPVEALSELRPAPPGRLWRGARRGWPGTCDTCDMCGWPVPLEDGADVADAAR